jgi:hypothetical protein
MSDPNFTYIFDMAVTLDMVTTGVYVDVTADSGCTVSVASSVITLLAGIYEQIIAKCLQLLKRRLFFLPNSP